MSRVEGRYVLACCAAASLAATAWCWRQGSMLNYGDAVAHLHIARRVIDSHRPGLSQLGSVWLPLPHLLMIPFVAVYAWWANGIAGMIPSALAYLAGCVGVYRLARRWLQPSAAALALAFFATNPNLLYLQSTAMTEPLFLCEMIWVSVGLVEWRASVDAGRQRDQRRSSRLLFAIAPVLVAAVFTRYDGWVMALLGWTSIGVVLLRRGKLRSRAFWVASVFVVAAPVVWCAYNGVVFGDCRWLRDTQRIADLLLAHPRGDHRAKRNDTTQPRDILVASRIPILRQQGHKTILSLSPCPVEPLILALQIRKRGTFSIFGGTSADLQRCTHHWTHPAGIRYLGERSR